MPLDIADPKWYVLRVKPRHEQTSAAYLEARGLEHMAPTYRALRRWSDRSKQLDLPLFPGYLFCRFVPSQKLSILTVPGVYAIVSFGKLEIPVDDHEIANIQALMRSGLDFGPWPYLRAGDPVRIESGCLAGVFGTVIRLKDTCRVIVSVELLQRSVAVEINRDHVQPHSRLVARLAVGASA
jgi:transcription antitermination factor NusG